MDEETPGELLQMFKNEIYGELPPRSDHGGISDYPTWRFGLVQLLLAAKVSAPVWNKTGFARIGKFRFFVISDLTIISKVLFYTLLKNQTVERKTR
jgi:hypothetical protein